MKRGRPKKPINELVQPQKRVASNSEKTIEFFQKNLQIDDNEMKDVVEILCKKFNIKIDHSDKDKKIISTLGNNIKNLYEHLPVNSPLKYPILKVLSKDIKQSDFVSITNIDKTIICKCQSASLNSIKNLKTHDNHSGGSEKVYKEEDIVKLKNWIKETCPVPSGSKYQKHVYFCTLTELFERYCKEATSRNLPLFSQTKFEKVLHTLNIRQGSYNFSSICETCSQNPAEMSEEDWEELNEHLEVKKIQEEHFYQVKHSLKSDEVLILQDFSSFSLPLGKCKNLFINILILTKYTKVQDKLVWNFYDYVSLSEDKQTADFVDSSWCQFIDQNTWNDISKLYIYSDGGPKHFKVVISFF